jgi:dTDP-L-rhamnose 4-epimerase
MPENTPYAGVASIFRSALAAGRPPRVFEDGGQLRDFVHVDDVARSVVLALERAAAFDGPLNVASGTPRTVGELARELCAATGCGYAPVVTGDTRAGDVRHVFAATQRARTHLGFTAQIEFIHGIGAFAHAPLRRASDDR